MWSSWFRSISILWFAGLCSCGYSLHREGSLILERAGIHRVYVAPVINNSYKAGAEILVYNALIREIASQGQIHLVKQKEDADAIIQGFVTTADYAPISFTTGGSLPPTPLGAARFSSIEVASIYSASLACSFDLRKMTKKGVKDPYADKVWSSGFSRTKPFPANNQLSSYGTTSAIINDSEFDRALSDLATAMMGDVHESLLSMF